MKFIRSTGDLISASSRLWPPRLPEWLLSQPSENAGSIEILAAKDVLAKLLLISKSRNKFGGKLLVELTTVDIGIYFRYHVRQSNIQLTCYSFRSNFVKTRLRCSLLNCSYTLPTTRNRTAVVFRKQQVVQVCCQCKIRSANGSIRRSRLYMPLVCIVYVSM